MWQKYFKELITTIQCNTAISSVKFFILLLDHAGNDKRKGQFWSNRRKIQHLY